MKRSLIHILALLPVFTTVCGQELVTGLVVNTRVKAEWEERSHLKSSMLQDTVELPFFDDFSWSDVYPADSLWSDNFVFVNNTYPEGQVTMGVATFDALDNTGRLYAGASSYVFEADHLTSAPINLGYAPSENIYLSFFYQPQGIADSPESSDSLTLQFYSPVEQKWTSVWSSKGEGLHPFKPVIIPVVQSKFLLKGFRFRFVNYASLTSSIGDPALAGNCDQWNIDWVYLDRNRTPGDTIPADVAFTTPVRSVLKTYESMPWNHFREAFLYEMGSSLALNYRNNDEIVRNVTRSFRIKDLYDNNVVHTSVPAATNVDSFTDVSFNASLLYTYNSPFTDSALFRITAVLKTDDFDPKLNDTIRYDQRFHNYFSYDDGTSEAGYGINGQGSRNAMVAILFRSYAPDTIRAVDICFNDSWQSANQRAFDIAVWDYSSGLPREIIYLEEELMVDPGSEVNGFARYILSEPVPVDGYFFVGWKQRSETFLNAGYDLNTQLPGGQFYYLNGSWNPSQEKGTIMLHPVVGARLPFTGIRDVPSTVNRIRIWPNPAREILNVDISDELLQGPFTITVFDTGGRMVMREKNSSSLGLSDLPEGIYFLVVEAGGKRISSNKFIRMRQ